MRFRHFPALDGLRAVAILTVMAYHLITLVPELRPFVNGGYLGVDIFFVLSGFLITSILLKEHDRNGRISLKNFFVRRFFRLAPAFWTFLLSLYLFGNYILPLLEASVIYSNHNFAYAFFYVMNLYKAAAASAETGNLNHTWSLAIEEQFYVFWSVALCLSFAVLRSRRAIAIATALLISLLVLWRSIRVSLGAEPLVMYYSTETRIDALLIGCLASMVFCWRLIPNSFFASRFFDWLFFSAVLCAFFVFSFFYYTEEALYFGYISLFAASVAVVILWLVTREKSAIHYILESRPMRWIGLISYSLYLWHYAFYEFARKTFDDVPFQVVFGLLFSIAAAAISYYLIEKPFLRLKERINSKNARQSGREVAAEA